MPELFSTDLIRSRSSFRLGTTSFIFPGHIIPNVKKLGSFFDEIELLVFESRPASVLPSKKEVNDLLSLSRDLDLTYNIHLPTDISINCGSNGEIKENRDTILNVMDLFAPLAPTTSTLHLEMPAGLNHGIQKEVEEWQKRTVQSLGDLVTRLPDPGAVSIETLDYPFSFIEKTVAELGVSVCLDAGHQIRYGHDLLKTFETYLDRIPLIHLHGVDFTTPGIIKDHKGLDKLPEKYGERVHSILDRFTGVVSLEVFNLENLNRSLAFLEKRFGLEKPGTSRVQSP